MLLATASLQQLEQAGPGAKISRERVFELTAGLEASLRGVEITADKLFWDGEEDRSHFTGTLTAEDLALVRDAHVLGVAFALSQYLVIAEIAPVVNNVAPADADYFRAGTTVGTQFHPEVDVSHVKGFLSNATDEYLHDNGVTREEILAGVEANEANNIAQCHALVDWFLDEVAFPD